MNKNTEKERFYIYKSTFFNTTKEDEDLKEYLREFTLEVHDLTEDDLIGDDYKTECLCNAIEEEVEDRYNDENSRILVDEGENLASLDSPGPIIAIATIGTWRGDRFGYKKIGDEICDILKSTHNYDGSEIFAEKSDIDRKQGSFDIKCRGVHHDGTNYITFRSLKDGVDLDELHSIIFSDERVEGSIEDRAKDWLRKNTKSIEPPIRQLYGWNWKRTRKPTVKKAA
jgi:hypothetical protein